MRTAYRVSLAGEVVATILDTKEAGSVLQTILIPKSIVKKGTIAVHAHVAAELEGLRQRRTKALQERLEKLRTSTRDLEVVLDGRIVIGSLSYDERPRALFTVTLLSPVSYASQTTVFGSMARGHIRGNDTHTPGVAWLPEVVVEAEEILLRLYRDQVHREKYIAAYELVEHLNNVCE